jgi:hypothetical protein
MGQGFLLGKPERIREAGFRPTLSAAERRTVTTQQPLRKGG